ncbi:hypothetical protein AB4099_18820 [Bosea sp. 2KB_26]|uniref:hypothetical protein n=1 Tax=Bosea sp. 2KB_26 TaxID=3237475 RepID=UPI003F8E6FD0
MSQAAIAPRKDYDWWRAAVSGRRGELVVGECECGYYAEKNRIPVAITREGDGSLKAWIGDKANLRTVAADAGFAETRFSFFCTKPVAYEHYKAAFDGKGWPWEVPDPDADTTRAENPRAVPGNNEPPEDLTPDQEIARNVAALEKQVKAWLEEIGGKPTTKIQADLVANYREKFLAFENEAEAKRSIEKKPHWDAGKAVDAKWNPIIDGAKTLKGQLWDIGQAYIKAENARLAEEARVENERLAEAAKLAKALNPEAPPVEVAPVVAKTVSIGTVRQVSEKKGGQVVLIENLEAFAGYLGKINNAEIRALAEKLATKMAKVGVPHMPGVTVDGKPRLAPDAA